MNLYIHARTVWSIWVLAVCESVCVVAIRVSKAGHATHIYTKLSRHLGPALDATGIG